MVKQSETNEFWPGFLLGVIVTIIVIAFTNPLLNYLTSQDKPKPIFHLKNVDK